MSKFYQTRAAAYERGLRPASKIRGVTADLIATFCAPQEQHRTSRRYALTAFYDPLHVRSVFGLVDGVAGDPAAIAALEVHKTKQIKRAAPKTVVVVRQNQTVAWLEGDGYYATSCNKTGCTVEIRGQYATVTHPDWSAPLTKRLTSRGFRIGDGR